MSETQSQVWLFGNIDFEPDKLPLKIEPKLTAAFPEINFIIKDPNEEWDLPDKLIIIDTVFGLKEITTFESLDDFGDSPRVTMHDFDLLTNLKWLAKLKKLPPFLIIGVPPTISEPVAIKQIRELLQAHVMDALT
jgi:hypothetical protein